MVAVRSYFAQHKWVRRTLKITVCIVLILGVLLLALRLLAMTGFGRNFVEARLEALNPAGQMIQIDGLSGDLLGKLQVSQIRILDADGLWLVGKNINVEWSPGALLKRHIIVNTLTAERLDIIRRPLMPESGTDNDTPKYLDLSVELGELNIPTLAIGGALIGQERTFALAGSLEALQERGHLAIGLVPTEAEGDRVNGRLAWQTDRPLRGNLKLNGPEGGLLAQLIGLQLSGPLEAQISADGTSQAWQISAGMKAGEVDIAALDATGDTVNGQGTGKLQLSAFTVLADLTDLLGDTASFQASLTDAEILKLSANTDELALTVDGAIDIATRQTERLKFILDIASPARLAGLPPQGLGPAHVEGDVSLSTETIVLRGKARVDAVQVGGIEARRLSGPLEANFSVSEQSLQVNAAITGQNVSVSGLSEDQIGSAPRLSSKFVIDLKANKLELEQSNLNIAMGTVSARGRADLNFDALALNGLARFAGTTAPNPLGPLNWRIKRAASTEPLSFAVKGDADIGAMLEIDNDWTSAPFKIDALGNLQPDNSVKLSHMSIANDALALTGDGQLGATGMVNAAFNIQAQAGEIDGLQISSLDIDADAAGTLDDLSLKIISAPISMQRGEDLLQASRLDSQARLRDGVLSSTFIYEGTVNNTPARLMARPLLSGDIWELADIDANYGAMVLKGDLSGAVNGTELPTGALMMNGRLPYLGQNIPVSGRALLSPERTEIDLTLDAFKTEYGNIETLTLSGAGTYQSFTGSLISSGRLTAGEKLHAFGFTVPIAANLTNRVLELEPKGSIAGLPLETIIPIRIQIDDETQIEGALALLGGTAQIDVTSLEDNINGMVSLSDLNIAPLAIIFDRPEFIGTLDARLMTQGKLLAPTGTMEVELTGLSHRRPDAPIIDLSLLGEFANGRSMLRSRIIDDENNIRLSIEGDAPFGWPIDPRASINLALSGGGDLDPLWSLFGSPETRLDGKFTLAGDIDGTLEDLRSSGEVTLNEASFEDGIQGFALNDINLAARLSPDAITVSSFRANGAQGGGMTGAGRYGLDGNGDIAITLDQLDAFRREDIALVLSGPVSVSSGPNAIRIDGSLIFDRAEVRIDALPQAGYQTLDIVFPDIDGNINKAAKDQRSLQFDIGLKSDRRIFINGNGIKSEWGIDAQLTGTARTPKLTGQARMVRGGLDFAGRNFQFQDSAITFAGDPLEARLALRAERTNNDLTAGFLISGTPLAPEFSLTSEPALPDDEILARILFGRSPAQLGPLQAAQLGAAITSLTTGGGIDPVGALQNAIGIDRIDFDVSETGESSLGIGENIGRNIYVELRTNARGATGLGVEWTPRDNIAVTTDIGAEEPPRFGIQWRKDFDLPGDAIPKENVSKDNAPKD